MAFLLDLPRSYKDVRVVGTAGTPAGVVDEPRPRRNEYGDEEESGEVLYRGAAEWERLERSSRISKPRSFAFALLADGARDDSG